MRQARGIRRPSVAIELQRRDEELLHALARFRIARTSDLLTYGFATVRPDTAAVRLRKLFDAGYLAVTYGDRASENVYSLGFRGRRWAREHGHELGRLPKAQGHHLAVVRAWIELACAFKADGITLERADPDWELRARLRGATSVPDLVMELEHRTLIVEVDRGTEPTSVLKAKLQGYYRDYVASLWENAALLVALENPSARRLEAVTELADQYAFTFTEIMPFPLRLPLAARGVLPAERLVVWSDGGGNHP